MMLAVTLQKLRCLRVSFRNAPLSAYWPFLARRDGGGAFFEPFCRRPSFFPSDSHDTRMREKGWAVREQIKKAKLAPPPRDISISRTWFLPDSFVRPFGHSPRSAMVFDCDAFSSFDPTAPRNFLLFLIPAVFFLSTSEAASVTPKLH